MAQLIDKSALTAEIDRRIKERDFQMKRGCWISSTYMYEDLLDFIDTLKVKEVQEEPISEDLEEAAEEYIELPDSCLEYSDGWEEKSDWQYIEKAFKAGAKWQVEQIIEKACEWLLKNDSYAKPTEVLVRDFRKAMEE